MSKKQNYYLDVKYYIWDTNYTLTKHRNGDVSVKCPTTKSTGCGSETLSFYSVRITKKSQVDQIKKFFERNTLVMSTDDGGAVTIDDAMFR